MGTQDKTENRNIDAGISIGPDATIGDKVRALRLSKKMTMADLARTSGLSDRAIRFVTGLQAHNRAALRICKCQALFYILFLCFYSGSPVILRLPGRLHGIKNMPQCKTLWGGYQN